MTGSRWLAGVALVAAIGVGGWVGVTRGGLGAAAPTAPTPKSAPEAAAAAPVVSDISAAATTGGTPMAERVAVIGLLNKRNGEARELTMKPGQAFRVGDTIVRLRACEKTAPWEQDQLTGAFLQLDVRSADQRWKRAFSGWIFRERPALNVVQHPIYDVWPKSCTMAFPVSGPDTEVLPSPVPRAARPSSARNAPVTTGEPAASPAEPAPSASPSTIE